MFAVHFTLLGGGAEVTLALATATKATRQVSKYTKVSFWNHSRIYILNKQGCNKNRN